MPRPRNRFSLAQSALVDAPPLPPIGRSAAITAGLLGLSLAVLAFVNAAAGVGLRIPVGAALGPGFAPAKIDLVITEQRQFQAGFKAHGDAARTARQSLELGPLNARALRVLGLSKQATGDMTAARAAMVMGDRLSRRDAATQAWLSDDAIRRNQIADALPHIDRILRTMPSADDALLTRLVAVLPMAEGRRALAPLITPENPWLTRYLRIAVNTAPKAAPLGQLLAEVDGLPTDAFLAESYAKLVARLADEGEFDVLRRVYPKLPGTMPRQLVSATLPDVDDETGFAPVSWDIGQRSDRGAAPMGDGSAEFFAIGDVRGVAARKLVYTDAAGGTFRFGTVERDGGPNSSANWRLTCVVGPAKGAVANSVNLLRLATPRAYRMTLSAGCTTWMMEMIVDGGTRRAPTRIVLDDLRLAKAAS